MLFLGLSRFRSQAPPTPMPGFWFQPWQYRTMRNASARSVEALTRLGARSRPERTTSEWLRDAATNLNGLPASAFDALKLLPSSAETLIHLLLSARDAGERGVIWALQNELPFLWLALPLRAWWSAMKANCTALANVLESALGKKKAMNEAVAWLRGVCGDLTALEPALETIFGMAGLPIGQATDRPSLRDLTSSYIRNQHQRGGDAPNNLAERLASVGLKLPPEIETKVAHGFCGPLRSRPARSKRPGKTRPRPASWR